jgi:hypothetical protein
VLQTGLICRFRPFRLFSSVRARARVGVHERSTRSTRLTCGSASYSLNTYGPEDFPRLPEIQTRGRRADTDLVRIVLPR